MTSAATPRVLTRAVTRVGINGVEVDGLMDSGSSESFIHPGLVNRFSLTLHPSTCEVSMASASLSTSTSKFCLVDLQVQGRNYKDVRLSVLLELCSDIILGQDFQALYDSVTLTYGGDLPPLVVCGLSQLLVDPPALFVHLTADI